MSRFLVVTWDGAGNLVPTLGIARALVEHGHDVRVLGHVTIAERFRDLGVRFLPLSESEGWSPLEDPGDAEAEIKLLIDELCFSSTIAADLGRELDRESADAVLVDCMLFTAIDVALASGTPTAKLFHSAYTLFRGGPLVEMFAPGIAIVNAHRADLGLPSIEELGEVHDACARALVALPAEFEADVPDAANVVRIGPVLDGPPISRETEIADVGRIVDRPADSPPLVLISLSTSEQGQAALLQRCVDAVAGLPVRCIVTTGPIDPASVTAGTNTTVLRHAHHPDIMPSTSLVITHAGAGTTMCALSSGVPLLCTPIGRDQFFNAARVEALGAGRMLMPGSGSETIAETAMQILTDERFRLAADRMALAIGAYGGAAQAVAALEALTENRSNPSLR